jgi:YHS domain-containing protein
MFRVILYMILFALLLSVVRGVLSIVAKAFAGLSDTSSVRAGNSNPRPHGPSVGELKKDPVCGTFISTETAFQKSSGGQTYYFCSTQCRDRFKAA